MTKKSGTSKDAADKGTTPHLPELSPKRLRGVSQRIIRSMGLALRGHRIGMAQQPPDNRQARPA